MQTEYNNYLNVKTHKRQVYTRLIKRPMDIILSLLTIIVLSPLLLLIAILVRIKLGKPVLFKQRRPGYNEKIFTLYKFRTMKEEQNSDSLKLSDNERLTSFGRRLRETSLDELPELINIIKGEMSLIGPRPLALQYLPYYTFEERKRHNVRPGLSGLAQINGRNALSWEQKFAFDNQYIQNISFMLDFKIIVKSIIIAFKRTNIGERGKESPIDFDIYRKNQMQTEVIKI